ncbi:hypothetical protein BH10ACT2_BH10ACT2_16470 [soil metagenome]
MRPLAQRAGLELPTDQWWVEKGDGSVGQLNTGGPRRCNICGWSGAAFLGVAHVESALCPRCESSARDRFLLWCSARSPASRDRKSRVLETSPRMGTDYRAMMSRHFDYRASDFDLGAHKADIQIDLQKIALPDASLDLLLTPHVLEHVPDTAAALAEIYRVLQPKGRMYLQVPLGRGATAAPSVPEYHADNTLVCWNFGWDLTDMLRAAGFITSVLVTADFAQLLRGDGEIPAPQGDVFDVPDIVRGARPDDLTIAATSAEAEAMGWLPSYQFVTWECVATAP